MCTYATHNIPVDFNLALWIFSNIGTIFASKFLSFIRVLRGKPQCYIVYIHTQMLKWSQEFSWLQARWKFVPLLFELGEILYLVITIVSPMLRVMRMAYNTRSMNIYIRRCRQIDDHTQKACFPWLRLRQVSVVLNNLNCSMWICVCVCASDGHFCVLRWLLLLLLLPMWLYCRLSRSTLALILHPMKMGGNGRIV